LEVRSVILSHENRGSFCVEEVWEKNIVQTIKNIKYMSFESQKVFEGGEGERAQKEMCIELVVGGGAVLVASTGVHRVWRAARRSSAKKRAAIDAHKERIRASEK